MINPPKKKWRWQTKIYLMKKVILVATFAILSVSCGNEKAADSTTQTITVPAEENTIVSVEDIKSGKFDPVCEMTYDTSWVESTVYMHDTIRFCSENCKTAFVARPEKYLKMTN